MPEVLLSEEMKPSRKSWRTQQPSCTTSRITLQKTLSVRKISTILQFFIDLEQFPVTWQLSHFAQMTLSRFLVQEADPYSAYRSRLVSTRKRQVVISLKYMVWLGMKFIMLCKAFGAANTDLSSKY